MKVEDKKVFVEVNTIDGGETFEYMDAIWMRIHGLPTREETIACANLKDGRWDWFADDTLVTPINAKVVIE